MRVRLIVWFVLLARLAAAQAPDTTRQTPRTTVSGVVRDSIARAPLAGATVQLVAADSLVHLSRTTVSDSLGQFILADVPAGRYILGFYHAMLDSLGLEPVARRVNVDASRPLRADLAIPSAARLRAIVCGPGPDSGSVVVGVLRDSRYRMPVAGVTVTGEWLELTLTPKGLDRRQPRRVATTAKNGWFAFCNLPSTGTISLMATRGADSTDLVEIELPDDRFFRRDLYLGSARIVLTADSTPSDDSLAPRPTRRRAGDGRLSGVVVIVETDMPLAGAEVSILDGPRTRANELGEWTLVGAPNGTRLLEVRAVGYYPERRAVNVVAGEAPIRTALSAVTPMLDTVRVTAMSVTDRNLKGFENRRRSGVGRYLTADEVARQRANLTSDLLRFVPSVRVERNRFGQSVILMRGSFDARCSPAIYIDGHYSSEVSADDLDGWVRPDEVAGVEIYSSLTAPPQFSPSRGNCGSIVIWTKAPTSSSKLSWTTRVIAVLAVAAAVFGIETAVHRR